MIDYFDYCKKKRSIEETIEYLKSKDCKLLNGDIGKPDRNINYTQYNELLLCEALLKNQLKLLVDYANETFRGGIH